MDTLALARQIITDCGIAMIPLPKRGRKLDQQKYKTKDGLLVLHKAFV